MFTFKLRYEMNNYFPRLFLFGTLIGVISILLIFASLAEATATEIQGQFDPSTLYVRQTIDVPFASEMAMMPDGPSLFILQRTDTGNESAIVSLDTTTYQTQTIPLGPGMPMGLAFTPTGSRVYVAISKQYFLTVSPGSNRVTVVNPANGSIVTSVLTGDTNYYGPTQVVISPDGNKAYVTDRGPHLVHVLNTPSNTIDTSFAVSYVPMAVAITADGSRLYTVNRFTNDVTAFNTVNNSLIATIPLSLVTSVDLNAITISEDGTRAFVVGTSSNDIAVLDINPVSPTYHQQIATLQTTGDGLTKVIVTPDNRYAFVTSQGTDELLVVDVDPNSPTYGDQVGQLLVGDEPASVVFHDAPGVIAYVSNHGSGTVSVIGYQEAIMGLAAANDSPTVIGSNTHLTATITAGTNVTYTWAFGDGTGGNGMTATHTYPALGTYIAVITATNQVSQMTATTTVEVVDIPIVGLTASNSSPTIVGNATFFNASTTSGANIQYTWAFGDGSYGSGPTPIHIYPAVGNYTAIVTATNTNNSLSTTTPVTVIDVAVSGLAAANDSPTILGNNTHLFATVNSGTNIQYSWAFGDGSYGSGASSSHVYPAVGNYTAVVTATNSNNSQSASTLVTIESGISYTYLPMVSFCEATPIWADIALVIDTSGSMADPTEPGGVTKLAAAKTAAATFLTFLDFTNQRDQASLVSFDNIATLEHPLSRNEVTLLTAINNLQLGNLTRMDLGLQTALLELTGIRHDPDNQTVIIFLTDGYPNGTTEAEVLAQALLAKNAGITIFTIGLGSGVNSSLLQAVASTPAYYYPSPSTGDLSAIYQQIASSLACR
jgi:YVTN family beta-propeller protein